MMLLEHTHIVRGNEEKYLENLICEKLGCDRDNIMGHELYLYNQEKAKLWGNQKQFISGQRIDNPVRGQVYVVKKGNSVKKMLK